MLGKHVKVQIRKNGSYFVFDDQLNDLGDNIARVDLSKVTCDKHGNLLGTLDAFYQAHEATNSNFYKLSGMCLKPLQICKKYNIVVLKRGKVYTK